MTSPPPAANFEQRGRAARAPNSYLQGLQCDWIAMNCFLGLRPWGIYGTGHPGELPSRQRVSRGFPPHFKWLGASSQLVQRLQQRCCEQCFGGPTSNGFGGFTGLLPTTTQQSTFCRHGQAACEPMSFPLGVYPGGRKAPGNGPGVGSGCSAVSSQSEGPGFGPGEGGEGGPGKARSWCWSLTGLPAVEPPGGGSKVALNGRARIPKRGVMAETVRKGASLYQSQDREI